MHSPVYLLLALSCSHKAFPCLLLTIPSQQRWTDLFPLYDYSIDLLYLQSAPIPSLPPSQLVIAALLNVTKSLPTRCSLLCTLGQVRMPSPCRFPTHAACCMPNGPCLHAPRYMHAVAHANLSLLLQSNTLCVARQHTCMHANPLLKACQQKLLQSPYWMDTYDPHKLPSTRFCSLHTVNPAAIPPAQGYPWSHRRIH